VCALLAALDLAVFAPVWHHQFTTYDDPLYIGQNPEVVAGLTWHGVVWAFTTGREANWHPLTWLSHMLDVELFGLTPGPHHVMSLLLHIASTLLLFGVLQRMTGQVGRSAVVAALFGVHPLHVESVAWAAERKDVLSTLFWMLTLWAYVGYVRGPSARRYLAVLGLFGAGLMAKPMLVTLPFVLLLLDFWPLGRMAPSPGEREGPTPLIDVRAALGAAREKLPLLALTLASSVVTFLVQRQGGAVARSDILPLWQRVSNAMVSYVAYIGKMLWPTQLAAFYPYPHAPWPWWMTAGSVAMVAAITAGVLLVIRRHPYLSVGWLWYVGTLVPVIGLVQVGSARMADRYTYVPLIGLFIALAWAVPELLARWPPRRVALPIAASVVIAVCAVLASLQVRHWQDTVALWTRSVEVTPDDVFLRGYLGNALAQAGRFQEALVHHSEALRLRPGVAETHNNLGFTLANLGRIDEAMAQYAEALRVLPEYAEAHNNLGMALAAQGKIDEALREFLEATRIKPNDAEMHINAAMMLGRKGQAAEAIHHYTEALRVNPADAEVHYNLGVLLAGQGKLDEAARHLETAVQLNPRFQKARRALGELAGLRGRAGPGIR
jgi:Flp pilus assembly protein TadD